MQVGFDSPQQEQAQAVDSVTATGVILDNWRHAKEDYDKAKARLDECKGYVIEHIGSQINVGTTRFQTNFFTLKTSVSKQYKVNAEDMNALNQALNVIANICGGEVAGSLLSWKPTLNTRVYDSLPHNAKQEIDKFISLSYGQPTFSIEKVK